MTLTTFTAQPAIGNSVTPTDFERLQRILEITLKQVFDIPWLDGILYEDLTLTGGADYVLQHKLGRTFRGWWVVKPSGTTDKVYESATTNIDDTSFLYLTCTNTQTVSIWVW